MKTQSIICSLLFFSVTSLAAPQIACYDVAKNNRGLTNDEAVALCRGAKSNWPIQCFDATSSRPLSAAERMTLCAGAENIFPVQCYDLGQSRGLAVTQIMTLCAAR